MHRLGLFLMLFVAARPALADPPANFEREIQPFFVKHCYACHGDAKKKAKLNFQQIHSATEAPMKVKNWGEVAKRVRDKEMPPEGSPPPTDAERATFVAWAEYFVEKPKVSDCKQIANDQNTHFYKGHVMSRRLTRAEYANSVRDLTGVELPVNELLPSDGAGGEGFDTSGDTLYLSVIHLEKYLDAANRVIDAAFAKPEWKARLIVDAKPSRDAARANVAAFARKAFRRPVAVEDIERFLTVFDKATGRGVAFPEAVKLPFKAVLLSANFLFLAEPLPKEEGVRPIDSFTLASRLSYFLWSTMPDDELIALAEKDRLQDDAVIKQQVRRMLADPRAIALGENFAMQWLGLMPFGTTTRPDAKRFPEFDDELAKAMRQEAVLLVANTFRENRSLLDLVNGGSTFLNERLAKHYGIPGVTGPELRRVTLDDNNRGGVLGLGAVLTATSYPLRTSPVLRGKWLLEDLLGQKVPPPPPGAGELPKDDQQPDKLSLRQRLEQHRAKPECSSCHARMDPLGFGLENFDPIGRWRTTQNGQPIDSAGTLPSGEKFATPAELKAVILKRKGEFLRHLSRKLYGYAMGRNLDGYDECVLDACVKGLEADGHKSGTLVETIVLSFQFRNRYYKQ